MPPFPRKWLYGSRYPYAVLAGFCLAAAFPNWSVAGLAWLAPGLIVALALNRTGGESFRLGYVAGLAHYLASLSWLLNIPYRWHGIPFAPALGWLSLSAFLSLFIGVWVWLVTGLARKRLLFPSMEGENRAVYPKPSWLERTVWCLTAAAGWVAVEMLLARIFGGFPWNVLPASQYRLTPLLQVASITGVYGISFLMVWFSMALVGAGARLIREPTNRSVLVVELAVPALAVALTFGWGLTQMRGSTEPESQLYLSLVQPSIPQTVIWDPGADNQRLEELLQLTEEALTNKTDVVVWPEAAVPKLLRYDQEVFDRVTGLARQHQVWMVIGADDAEPAAGRPNDANYFNSSFLIGPDGTLRGRYQKQALVMFGEYLPLTRWLPFLRWFTPIQGGFTRGNGPVPFRLKELGVTTSVLICFEDIFPQLGRRATEPETSFLVNITNDGWFGQGSAQWQQALTALFRAIENRRPLVRCTNNGLTCWFDAQGRLREVFIDAQGSIYGRGFLRIQLPINDGLAGTFYHRCGDWVGWGCVAWTLLAIGTRFRRDPGVTSTGLGAAQGAGHTPSGSQSS